MVKKILPSDLVPMDIFEDDFPIKIQLVYQKDEPPNIFGKIYHENARLWLHSDLATIVLSASQRLEAYSLVLYDGLRTSDAQALMGESDIVKANPQWLEEPGRLLSPPGGGAHPRGMAIDLSLRDEQGKLVDMGTDFDYLAGNSSSAHNRAHREYANLGADVLRARKILHDAMVSSARDLDLPLLPLPQEWWDFRFPRDYYEQFAPLSDHDLPADMRMTNGHGAQKQMKIDTEMLKDQLICKIKNI